MFRLARPAFVFLLLLIVVPAKAQVPGDPLRERLGVRISIIGTQSDLYDAFGHGYDFTLYFTERIYHALNLDIHIGATYMGDLLEPAAGEIFTDIEGVTSEMRFAYLSIGPQYVWRVNDTQNLYAALGIGIYSVSMLFDTGVQAFDLSDQNFGGSLGGGFLWRITDNWNIDVNVTAQMVKTGSNPTDLYPRFTNNGRNPLLLGFGLGFAMDMR